MVCECRKLSWSKISPSRIIQWPVSELVEAQMVLMSAHRWARQQVIKEAACGLRRADF